MSAEKLIMLGVLIRRRMLEQLRETNLASKSGSSNDDSSAAPDTAPVIKRRRRSRDTGLYVTPTSHGGVRTVFRKKIDLDEKDGGENDKGSSSERGFTIYNGHQVQHESFQEHKVSCIYQVDPETADIFSQQPRVHYVDANGKKRFTIFDYLVIKKDGKRIGIAVKEEEEREDIEAMFKLIAETSDQTDIDEAVVVSGEQATLQRYNNALDILWARDHAQHSEVELVAKMLPGRAEVQFWELYDRVFMGSWKRKAAIWDLIDRGILKPVNEGERINDLSRLTINI